MEAGGKKENVIAWNISFRSEMHRPCAHPLRRYTAHCLHSKSKRCSPRSGGSKRPASRLERRAESLASPRDEAWLPGVHSIVFLYFFALITEERFLISPCYSLELCIQMGISFLFSFAFHFSSFHSYCKASSDNHFAFLRFFFLGMVLIPVSCTMSQTSVHSSSGTLATDYMMPIIWCSGKATLWRH